MQKNTFIPQAPKPHPPHPRREAGFSLVEIMIVVAIIGVLAAVAIPQYRNYTSNSKSQVARSTLQQLYVALETYRAEEPDGFLCPRTECNGTGADTYTYTYTENDSGVTTSTSLMTGLSGGDPFLNDFQARSPGASGAILYDYSVTVTDGAGTAALTATPVAGRGAPAGNITIPFP